MIRPPWLYRVHGGPLGHITRQQRENIAALRSAGVTLSAIAERLNIDERTVRRHIAKLRSEGDERCALRPPGRPRTAHA